MNSALEDGSIGDLGIVVFDELHMLDEEHRGFLPFAHLMHSY